MIENFIGFPQRPHRHRNWRRAGVPPDAGSSRRDAQYTPVRVDRMELGDTVPHALHTADGRAHFKAKVVLAATGVRWAAAGGEKGAAPLSSARRPSSTPAHCRRKAVSAAGEEVARRRWRQ